MAYESILYDVDDRICTITLNRPDKLNAWTRQMHLDLKDAMYKAGADPEVRARRRWCRTWWPGTSPPASAPWAR